ncbi:hypothetical protein IWX48DRAFT_593581 [Phyllosticta citricarpa]
MPTPTPMCGGRRAATKPTYPPTPQQALFHHLSGFWRCKEVPSRGAVVIVAELDSQHIGERRYLMYQSLGLDWIGEMWGLGRWRDGKQRRVAEIVIVVGSNAVGQAVVVAGQGYAKCGWHVPDATHRHGLLKLGRDREGDVEAARLVTCSYLVQGFETDNLVGDVRTLLDHFLLEDGLGFLSRKAEEKRTLKPLNECAPRIVISQKAAKHRVMHADVVDGTPCVTQALERPGASVKRNNKVIKGPKDKIRAPRDGMGQPAEERYRCPWAALLVGREVIIDRVLPTLPPVFSVGNFWVKEWKKDRRSFLHLEQGL